MEYQNPVEITCHLIGNKTDNKITKVLRSWSQNTSERITNEHDKERHISPEEIQKIIDGLALI